MVVGNSLFKKKDIHKYTWMRRQWKGCGWGNDGLCGCVEQCIGWLLDAKVLRRER